MKRWLEGLWLLALIPGLFTAALDVSHGVTRPLTWIARLAPVLLWLGLVAWARVSRSPLAQQVRVELRLALLGGLLLLVSSSSALVQDAIENEAWAALMGVLPWVLAVVLPVSAVTLPMSTEHARGTFESLLATPRGAKVFAIKFALSSTLVCVSWLMLSTSSTSEGARWFALCGHLAAVVTVPTWFLIARAEGATLGLTVLVPYFLFLPVAYFTPELAQVALVLYGVVMLALVPWAVRRGAAGIPPWLTRGSSGGPRRVLFREQRDAMWMSCAGLLTGTFVFLEGNPELAGGLVFFFCGAAGVLSVSLAFAEARGQGTLEVELAAWERRRVLLQRAGGSLLVTTVLSVIAPLAFIATVQPLDPKGVLLWVLAMFVTWCISLAVAVHFSSSGASLMAGIGAVAGLFFAHFWGFAYAFMAAEKVSGRGSWMPLFFLLNILILAVTALLVAAHRFLRADRARPGVFVPATLGTVAAAGLLGVLGAVIG